MREQIYEDFIRNRITELRLSKNVSEHKMSLDLGKSGAYIRSITNGSSLPSFKEFFNILDYFNISITEFFAPMYEEDSIYGIICEKLRHLDDKDLLKINTFLDWFLDWTKK